MCRTIHQQKSFYPIAMCYFCASKRTLIIHYSQSIIFNIWHKFEKESYYVCTLIIQHFFLLFHSGVCSNITFVCSNWHLTFLNVCIRSDWNLEFFLKLSVSKIVQIFHFSVRTIFKKKYHFYKTFYDFFSIVSFPLVINDWHLVAFIIEEEDLILAF